MLPSGKDTIGLRRNKGAKIRVSLLLLVCFFVLAILGYAVTNYDHSSSWYLHPNVGLNAVSVPETEISRTHTHLGNGSLVLPASASTFLAGLSQEHKDQCQQYSNVTEPFLLTLRKFIPEPSQFNHTYSAACWKGNIDLSPLSHNNDLSFNFLDNSQAVSLYNKITSLRTKELICLPNVYFKVPPKCGTTQLYKLLLTHPLMEGALIKEPHWWGTKMHLVDGKGHPYNELSVLTYLAQFQKVASCSKKQPLCMGVDGSTSDDNDLHFGNCGVTHILHKVVPNAKFIVLLRNPTERLYSQYFYNLRTPSLKEKFNLPDPNEFRFHKLVEQELQGIEKCLNKHASVKTCIQYDFDYHARFNEGVSKNGIALGLYYARIQEWLLEFPIENFIFIHTEDLSVNTHEVVGEIWRFLGLPVIYTKEFDEVSRKKALYQSYPPMLPATRLMLDNFYREHNKKLAELLKDDRYLWNND